MSLPNDLFFANDKSDPQNAIEPTDKEIADKRDELLEDWEIIHEIFSDVMYKLKVSDYLPIGDAIKNKDAGQLGNILMQSLADTADEFARERVY